MYFLDVLGDAIIHGRGSEVHAVLCIITHMLEVALHAPLSNSSLAYARDQSESVPVEMLQRFLHMGFDRMDVVSEPVDLAGRIHRRESHHSSGTVRLVQK